MLIVEIIIVAALFVLNGFFSMAELSIVSSRRARLERLAKEGYAGAQVAITLADDPARMLAAVQIGFTTTATLAGIFSGATLAERLEHALPDVPVLAEYGKALSIVVVTVCVTYTALIVGELTPKHIALNDPESIAIRVARPLAFVAWAAAPAVWFLNYSTRLFLRLLRLRPRFERPLSEDDIHYLVAEGVRLGVIHSVERDMIEGVLDLGDSPVRTIMTPRPQVRWLDLNIPKEQMLSEIRSCPHAQLLVGRGAIDKVVGVVRKQDLLDQVLGGRSPDVEQVTRLPLIVHESTTVLRTLDLFRKTPVHTAIVVDEFGVLQGIVTRTDLLETVAGELPKIDAPAQAKVTQREDGSYLIDGSVAFPDVARLIGMSEPPSGDYLTLAGFILSQIHQLPKPGDHVATAGWRFEIVDMDGQRIDMVLAQRRRTIDQAKPVRTATSRPPFPLGQERKVLTECQVRVFHTHTCASNLNRTLPPAGYAPAFVLSQPDVLLWNIQPDGLLPKVGRQWIPPQAHSRASQRSGRATLPSQRWTHLRTSMPRPRKPAPQNRFRYPGRMKNRNRQRMPRTRHPLSAPR